MFILLKLWQTWQGNAKNTSSVVLYNWYFPIYPKTYLHKIMLFYKHQSFWSFNHHEWTNIPNSHYKRHHIKIYTCWNVTTIRQLNRPPEVNITLIIQKLVLFFHWMQPNTLNFMQYFSAKTKIISLSFTLCLTHVCNFVENVFWNANKYSNSPIFRNIQSSY